MVKFKFGQFVLVSVAPCGSLLGCLDERCVGVVAADFFGCWCLEFPSDGSVQRLQVLSTVGFGVLDWKRSRIWSESNKSGNQSDPLLFISHTRS
jgi:hypothetical protein